MSEILQEFPKDKIKEAAIKLIRSIFHTKEEPRNVIISEFTIILRYRYLLTKDRGLSFYSKNGVQIVFQKR